VYSKFPKSATPCFIKLSECARWPWGIRIVREGATLIPTLDAHAQHPGVFTEKELVGFATATAPASQLASQQRHGVMKKARSKKTNDTPESIGSPDPLSQ